MEGKRKLNSSWHGYSIPHKPRLGSVVSDILPGESGIDSVVIKSVPGEPKPRLSSVVVVPKPGELKSKAKSYSHEKRQNPCRQYYHSRFQTHYKPVPQTSKTANQKKVEVSEIVQELSKAFKKIHISSTATQTEIKLAHKTTQTESDLLLEVNLPKRKNNRRCYKCQGAHLRKFCPFKNTNTLVQRITATPNSDEPKIECGQDQAESTGMTACASSPLQQEHRYVTKHPTKDNNFSQEEEEDNWENAVQEFEEEELDVDFHISLDDSLEEIALSGDEWFFEL